MEATWAVLGIDFGATKVKLMAFDGEGRVIAQRVEPSPSQEGPEAAIVKLGASSRDMIEEVAQRGYVVKAVGIGVCAPVRHGRGEIVESSVLPGWIDVPVAAPMSAALGLPVVVENDSNAAVMGEWWRGSAQGASVVAGLTLGTGIGGGLVVDGHVFHGGAGFGAEFGHIAVTDSPVCACRGRGCLGRVASITATMERYREMAGEGQAAASDIAELAALAEAGNAAAQQAIAVSTGYLAGAIVTIVNCLNPRVFVLAGGMASSLGDRLLMPIQERIRGGTYRCIAEEVRVVAATLGVFSGAYGAGYLALEAIPT